MNEVILDNMLILCNRAIQHAHEHDEYQVEEDIKTIKGGIHVLKRLLEGCLPPDSMRELEKIMGVGLS